jgi:hypothetical protein
VSWNRTAFLLLVVGRGTDHSFQLLRRPVVDGWAIIHGASSEHIWLHSAVIRLACFDIFTAQPRVHHQLAFEVAGQGSDEC